MNSFELRKAYLSYFENNGHTVVPSSSLIPAEDPTLLFTNAGMNQFKDCFLGTEKRSYTRAASTQKCVRAGGKHNDLDEVGFSERHLTFFEMLGNFSFGDYFKEEAMRYAWDFLTKTLGMDADKLYVTVFETDDESFNIWNKTIGIPTDRIFRLGEKDNFWAMGDTGPCGPCTEIYYDRGPEKQGNFATASPGSASPRYIEIWNNVFMQFNRSADGSMIPLTQKGVDTGMGLERLTMVMQGKDSVYETDIFMNLIEKIGTLSGISYLQSDKALKSAFHVMADHVRSTSLLIADGCSPSNEGRGYVLRKIIRRAALFTQKLSPDLSIFKQLADHYIELMAPIFPELAINRSLILAVLTAEIERFANNLVQGQNMVKTAMDNALTSGSAIISGQQAFKLYDTYGFPLELTHIIAKENNFSVDIEGFEKAMKEQQEQSGKKQQTDTGELVVDGNLSTTFVGYETFESMSPILFANVQNDHAWIITETSPFYVESGGQVNDNGWVTINQTTYPVVDLKKTGNHVKPAIAVKIAINAPELATAIKLGDQAHCVVDQEKRMNTVRNHTATHMLQAALIQVLGKQVKQAGSLVCSDYLRFDFTHHEALSKDTIKMIETIINDKVQDCIATNIAQSTLQASKEAGVISFFGEKYNPENVRVVTIPGFSSELCGGTHAHNTGIIGAFKIISETALATGTRRIVAVTGPAALELFQQSHDLSKQLCEHFKVKAHDVLGAVEKQQELMSQAQSAIRQLKKQLLAYQAPTHAQKISIINRVPFLYAELDEAGIDEMRLLSQELTRYTPGLYFLVSRQEDGKIAFLCSQSDTTPHAVDLKSLANWLKVTYQVKGGGNDKAIQGGIPTLPQNFDTALRTWLNQQ